LACIVLGTAAAWGEDADLKALTERIKALETRNEALQKKNDDKDTAVAVDQAIASANATQANVVTNGQKITVGGYIDTSFEYNFNQPNNTNNNLREFDVDPNGFNLHLAELTFDALPTKPGEAGFRLDLAFGTDCRMFKAADKFTLTSNAINNQFVDSDFKQAYVEYIVPIGCPGEKKGIMLDMGRFNTWAGYETVEAADNINSSRSFLFTFAVPITHTGVRATYKVLDSECDKWTVGAGIYNGWDNVQDQNRSKTGALYSDWIPTKWFEWTVDGLLGSERVVDERLVFMNAISPFGGFDPTNPTTPGFSSVYTGTTFSGSLDGGRDLRIWDSQRGAMRGLLDTSVIFKPHCGQDDLLVALNADFGHEKFSTWYGGAAYAKWQFAKKWYLGVRGEYFCDENGGRTGIPQTLYEGTATLDWALTDALHTRLEFRHDHSTKGVFSDKHATEPTVGPNLNSPFCKQFQNTVMMSWLYKF
jgi:hypothetical protein